MRICSLAVAVAMSTTAAEAQERMPGTVRREVSARGSITIGARESSPGPRGSSQPASPRTENILSSVAATARMRSLMSIAQFTPAQRHASLRPEMKRPTSPDGKYVIRWY